MSERLDLLIINSEPNVTTLNQNEPIPKHKTKVTLIEKNHNNKKKEFYFEVAPKEKKKIERKDANGTIINHNNKRKVKVTFRDNLNEKIGLCDIIDVESIKKYNYIPSENGYIDIYYKKKRKCCCSIY